MHGDGSLLTAYQLLAVLRRALGWLGMDYQYYGTHSFRIGAATEARAVGYLFHRTCSIKAALERCRVVCSSFRPERRWSVQVRAWVRGLPADCQGFTRDPELISATSTPAPPLVEEESGLSCGGLGGPGFSCLLCDPCRCITIEKDTLLRASK
ncbi:hypothetical protein NDU88_005074 [Pleurodeles waltl]|uniref:Tyr recombinase domain-containing protein n=1 Tax=Pleurodeles waltl TaxID=8319 RepID=A0AAV7UH43_PLEWA|nr:hypothetical protein NDU88_005074 [Pleurodeles waltl]